MTGRPAVGRRAFLAAGVFAALTLACGRGGHGSPGHGSGSQTTPQPPPTPDSTPIAALRTPAGYLLLQTPAPQTTPTPSAAPAANPAP
jgi:hypothetical protein